MWCVYSICACGDAGVLCISNVTFSTPTKCLHLEIFWRGRVLRMDTVEVWHASRIQVRHLWDRKRLQQHSITLLTSMNFSGD